jgi:serine protease Do
MKKVLFPFFGLGLLVLLVGMACVIGTQATPAPQPTATLPPPPPEPPAATGLDFNLDPTFGEQDLTAGFTPDPFDVPITSGGAVDVAYLGADCTGYAAQAPDFRLYWTGNSAQLSFMFVPGSGDEDTTLVVNLPDGSWICNDDSTSTNRNPLIVLSSPPEGRYDIWIGSYSAGDFITGTLRITETNLTP